MTKFTRCLAFLLAVPFHFTLHAQPRENVNNKSLLWKISGNHLAKPSYLFGTMHLICLEDYLWTEKMKESLAKSEKICFEMNLADPAVVMQTAALMMGTDGKKLEDYFTAGQYKLVSDYLKDSLGVDIKMFSQMKPVVLQSLMTQKEVSCENAISYEDTIMKTAQKAKKEIMGLEEPKEQLEALESIPADSVIKELLDEMQHKDNNSSDSEYAQLINAYKQQDLPALYTMITQSKDVGDNMGPLLDERNTRWIGRMTDKMHKSSVFFAVGAGHLWGNNGVIALLRNNGYKVEALK